MDRFYSSWRAATWLVTPMVFAAGCVSGTTWRWDEGHVLPTAPWQGVHVSASYNEYEGDNLVPCDATDGSCEDLSMPDAEPIVLDAAGAPVALDHVRFAAGEADERAWGWRPADGFAPGHYTVVGLVAVPELVLDLGFDVADIGTSSASDPSALAGRVWKLSGVHDGPLVSLNAFFLKSPGTELFFQLILADTSEPQLQVAMRRDGVDCSLGRGSATVDEAGLFGVAADALSINVVDHPAARVEGLALGVGWPSEGEPQGRFDALVDVDGFAPFVAAGMSGQNVCDAVYSAFGGSCTPCADGSPRCLRLNAVGLDFTEVSGDALAPELPACSTDPGQGLSGAVDANGQALCGCSQSGQPAGALLAALVALLAVRRRAR